MKFCTVSGALSGNSVHVMFPMLVSIIAFCRAGAAAVAAGFLAVLADGFCAEDAGFLAVWAPPPTLKIAKTLSNVIIANLCISPPLRLRAHCMPFCLAGESVAHM